MLKFYRCPHCGNIIEMVDDKGVVPFCCGEKMLPLKENTEENVALEKHIPVYEEKDNRIFVKVGEIEHPMLETHFIEWIYLITDRGVARRRLKPGQAPVVSFALEEGEVPLEVLAYCNLHGLWGKSID